MPDEIRRMVALGSSFAAGPGIEPVVDPAAMRSGNNYANLVARSLGAYLTDVTVSGATTETILRSTQRSLTRRFPPQITSVLADTDFVTVTAGGNDLGYLGGVLGTGLLNELGRTPVIGPIAGLARRPLMLPDAGKRATATQGLVEIAEQVQQRAPRARVMFIDYLPLFDESSSPESTGFDQEQIEHFREVAQILSEVYLAASRAGNTLLIPASAFEAGHGVGSAEPWIFTRQPLRSLGASFHPNAAGMSAVATAVLSQLGSMDGNRR